MKENLGAVWNWTSFEEIISSYEYARDTQTFILEI